MTQPGSTYALGLLLALVLAVPAGAATIRVQHPETIQAAVDAASNGDTIRVAAGVYEGFTVDGFESLTIKGARGATVTGAGAPAVDVTDCGEVVLDGLEFVVGDDGYPAVDVVRIETLSIWDCEFSGTLEVFQGNSIFVTTTNFSDSLFAISVFDDGSAGADQFLIVDRCDFTDVGIGVSVDAPTTVHLQRVNMTRVTSRGVAISESAPPSRGRLAGVTIERCMFQTVGTADAPLSGTAIQVADTVSLEVTHTKISGVTRLGIDVQAGVASMHLERVEFADVGGTAVLVRDDDDDSLDTDLVTISRCDITDAVRGIQFEGRGDFLVEHTDFEQVDSGAVYALMQLRERDEATVRVRRCKMSGVGEQAVSVEADGVVVENCRFYDTEDGIRIRGDDAKVRYVRVIGAAGSAIDVAGDRALIFRNRVRGATSVGIEFEGKDSRIHRNRVTEAENGIQCRSEVARDEDSRVNVTRNVVRNTTRGIYSALDGGSLERNRVSGSISTGIECDGSRTFFVGNRVRGSGEIGIEVDGSEHTFVGNTARGSGDCDYYEDVASREETEQFLIDNNFQVECFD